MRGRLRTFVWLAVVAAGVASVAAAARQTPAGFSVLAFYTGVDDRAHISFVGEANQWFAETGRKEGFTYEATTDWERLNAAELARKPVVVFLDTRPERRAQRDALVWQVEIKGVDAHRARIP